MLIQWNLGIRDTQGTVQNSPEFWGGLISQVQFYVLNRHSRSTAQHEVAVLNSQVVPISQLVLKKGFTVHGDDRSECTLGRFCGLILHTPMAREERAMEQILINVLGLNMQNNCYSNVLYVPGHLITWNPSLVCWYPLFIPMPPALV